MQQDRFVHPAAFCSSTSGTELHLGSNSLRKPTRQARRVGQCKYIMAWEKVFCLLIWGDIECLLFRTRNQRVVGLCSTVLSCLSFSPWVALLSRHVHTRRGTWGKIYWVKALINFTFCGRNKRRRGRENLSKKYLEMGLSSTPGKKIRALEISSDCLIQTTPGGRRRNEEVSLWLPASLAVLSST